MIGSGCSVATEPTAENSHYYNITQVRKEFVSSHHCKKKWVVLTHFSYLSFIPFSMSLNNFYSPMTFTNDLENQIKFLICLESKAGSGTSLCDADN